MKQLLEVKDRIDLTSEPLPIWQVRLLIPQPLDCSKLEDSPNKKNPEDTPLGKTY